MRDPRLAVAGTLAAAIAIALLPELGNGPLALLGFVVPVALGYACGAHAELWPGLAACVALAAGLQINTGFADFPNVEIAIAIFPPWWAGRQLRLRRALVQELEERTRELEDEQDTFVRLSVERERARIARDLHDIVSHHLAVIAVQAGAGRLARDWSAEASAGRLAAIGDAGRQALREADRLVTLLGPAGDGPPRLATLVERARTSGTRVALHPPDPQFPPEVEAIACRVVQEALTNAMKHAPGAIAELHVEVGERELRITVLNDLVAEPSALAATGSGLGLAGMEERLRALGGTLDARPDGRGRFELRALVPLVRTAAHVG